MTTNCKNCGTALKGNYCYVCGQKVLRPGDKRLKHLIIEFFHHFTHLDSKFLKTLRSILWRPGIVTKQVSEGITVPHFKLSALFLIGTIIYFLLPADFTVSSMNTTFEKQMARDGGDFYQLKKNIIEKKIATGKITREALAKRYDYRQHDYGKLLTLILIPLLIPVLWLINIVIRIFKKGHPITTYDLGIASLEINSIFLFGTGIISGLLIRLLTVFTENENIVFTCFAVLATGLAILLFLFFKNAYVIKWWLALICLMLLLLGYNVIISLYSLIAFLIFF